MKIFLSYSSQNRASVEPVNFALAAQGHDVFFDRDDLPAGTEYDQRIIEAVEGADLFVFMLSPASIRPGSYTLTELGLAQKKWTNPSGRVLPVAAEPVAFDHIPPYLKSVTVLEPSGNLAAAVVDAVRRLESAGQRPKRVALLASAAVLVALAIAAWFFFAGDRQKTAITGKDGAPSVLVPEATFTMGDGEESPYAHRVRRRLLSRPIRGHDRALRQVSRGARGDQPARGMGRSQVGCGARPAGRRRRLARGRCVLSLGRQAPADRSGMGARGAGHASADLSWGNEAPGPDRARFLISASGPYQGGLAPVGSHAAGQSSEGIQDLAGNASEWVADWYSESFATSDVRNPKGPESGTGRGIRGGGWQEPAERLRSAKRFYASPDNRAEDVGFRCARDAKREG